MPGLFVGQWPVQSMGNVKEVYVGSTKVWPTTVRYYGSRWLRGDSGVFYEGSNPGMAGSTPSGTGYGTYLWGCILPLNAGGQAAISFDFTTTWCSRGAFSNPGADNTKGAYTIYDDQQQSARATTAVVRAFTNPEDQHQTGRDAYARFSSTGALQWASEPGFSAVRVSAGSFQITCPGPLASYAAYASPNHTAQATSPMATPSNIKKELGTLNVITKLSGVQSSTGFTIWVTLA